jgi:hypothetical protein
MTSVSRTEVLSIGPERLSLIPSSAADLRTSNSLDAGIADHPILIWRVCPDTRGVGVCRSRGIALSKSERLSGQAASGTVLSWSTGIVLFFNPSRKQGDVTLSSLVSF